MSLVPYSETHPPTSLESLRAKALSSRVQQFTKMLESTGITADNLTSVRKGYQDLRVALMKMGDWGDFQFRSVAQNMLIRAVLEAAQTSPLRAKNYNEENLTMEIIGDHYEVEA